MQVQSVNYFQNRNNKINPAFGTLKLPEAIRFSYPEEFIQELEEAAKGFDVVIAMGSNARQKVYCCLARLENGNKKPQAFSDIFLKPSAKDGNMIISRTNNVKFTPDEHPLVSLVKGAVSKLQASISSESKN